MHRDVYSFYRISSKKEENSSIVFLKEKIAAGVISLLISVEMSRKGNCFAPVPKPLKPKDYGFSKSNKNWFTEESMSTHT